MKISIALATYNGGHYLQAQLDSFIAQTRQPNELVATDDGSTDNTVEILRSFAAAAPFEVIVQCNDRNHGYCGNFNQALLKTSGDLVFLSDQDDVWFPEKLERIASVAAEDPHALLLMNDAALTDHRLRDTGLTKLGQIESAGFKESAFVMGCCAAVKRDLLDMCLPIPQDYPAHDDWIVGIAEGMHRKRIVREVLQYYRRHGKNESQWIINRTTRVTRWHLYAEQWRAYLSNFCKPNPVAQKVKSPSVLPVALMRQWAEVTLEKTNEPYASDLRHFLVRLEQETRVQEIRAWGLARRNEIRQLGFMPRLLSVASFWRKGGYSAFEGFQSALRDLTGR